jgi:hypothetical protein
MNPESNHDEVRALILENKRLLSENNDLLKKMHRSAVRHFWFNIAWIVIFLGLPLLAFYKLLMPLYSSFETSGVSLEGQLRSMQELRGFLEQQR